MNRLQTYLKVIGACKPAIDWVGSYKTPSGAWSACTNPQWMIWLLRKRVDNNDKRFRLLAADFAESVLHLVRECDKGVCQAAITAARDYVNEKITADKCLEASKVVCGIASKTYSDYLAGSANADNVNAAYSAAYTAYVSNANSVTAAAGSASAAANAAANSDLIRKYFPKAK
jgi:hypothetical protein